MTEEQTLAVEHSFGVHADVVVVDCPDCLAANEPFGTNPVAGVAALDAMFDSIEGVRPPRVRPGDQPCRYSPDGVHSFDQVELRCFWCDCRPTMASLGQAVWS